MAKRGGFLHSPEVPLPTDRLSGRQLRLRGKVLLVNAHDCHSTLTGVSLAGRHLRQTEAFWPLRAQCCKHVELGSMA
jgi:hypothetical protein